MKEKIKFDAGKLWERVKNAFAQSVAPVKHIQQERDEELFVEQDKPRPFPLAVMFTVFRMMLLFVLLLGCAGVGLVLGVAKAYIDTTPALDTSLLTKSDRTSYIYDMDGKLISTYAGIEYRDWADIGEIPDMLINAVISIEDVRFYKHNGVDYKRLFAAIVGSLSASSDAGGSTITQQLVKNKLLTNEVSYKRKIQEAYLALQIEKALDKKDILEAYLNDVYLGQSNYGMKAAAKDYFGKELSELSIRECAMLAAMIQSPNTTDPRKNTYSRTYDSGDKAGQNKMDITNARTDKVINRMYSAGLISLEQRNAALTDTVYIRESSERTGNNTYLYYVEYALRQICSDILAQRGMLDTSANRAAVENELSRGGYSIYLCIDTSVQTAVQDTLANWENYPQLKNPSAAVYNASVDSDGVVEPQSAAVVIDQSTGELRAIIGGRTEPEVQKGFNRAYQSTQMEVGSSIKPLTVYGPALDLGLSPASMIANLPVPIESWDTETGYPAIGDTDYTGLITMRRAIVSSLNVAAARTLMETVSTSLAAKYLVNLGVDSSRVKETGSGLALGTTGITPIEMAAAYATIANGGEYLEPIAYTRVVDGNGTVVLDAHALQQTRRVYKATTAYMLVDVLTNAVQSGTGTRAKLDGITVAGKTGTNSDYSSAYFAGMTGYYTAVVWVGHDKYTEKLAAGSTGGKVAAPLWQAFMSKILAGLPDRQIIDDSPVELGLVKRTVCTVSGLLATDACLADTAHQPVTEWFDADNAPAEYCDMHVIASVCSASGEPASAFCPSDFVTVSVVTLIRPASVLAKYDQTILSAYVTNPVYTDLTADAYMQYAESYACSLHSRYGGSGIFGGSNDYTEAKTLIGEVRAYLSAVQNLSDTDRATLENGISTLEQYIAADTPSLVLTYYERLEYNFGVIYEANPPAATGSPSAPVPTESAVPAPSPSPTQDAGGAT